MTTKRAAIYVRQSQTSEGTISPALQEQHVREFIARQEGWTPTKVYSDIDISGRKTENRPGLLALVADYKAKKFDVAVADDYSRFSRDMSDGADLIGSMHVATYAEGIPDPDDDFAPLLYMLLAHKYSKDMGKRWKAAHAYRLAQGLPPNGVRQFGYRKLSDGFYVVHAEEAEVLRHLYSEYTRGVGTIRLVQWLAEQGITSVRGTAFTTSTLFKLLDKPFAAGFVAWAGVEHKGAHEPILTEGEWDSYWKARNKRKLHQAPRNPKWWLAGIARCGRCGGNLVSTTIKGKQSVNCSTYNNKGKAACAGVFRKRATVDFQTMMYLFSHEEQLAAAVPTDDEALLAAERAVQDAQAVAEQAQQAMTSLLLNAAGLGDAAAPAIAVRAKELEEAREALSAARVEVESFIPASTISEQLEKGFTLMGQSPEDESIPEDAIPEMRRVTARVLREVRVLPPVEGNRQPVEFVPNS